MKKILSLMICSLFLISGLTLVSCQKSEEGAEETKAAEETAGYGEKKVEEAVGYGEKKVEEAVGYGKEKAEDAMGEAEKKVKEAAGY